MFPMYTSSNSVVITPIVTLRRQRVVSHQPDRVRAVLLLTDIDGDGWSLLQPLAVRYEQDSDGSHLLTDDEFLVYGVGDSLEGAMKDYLRSLLEYYRIVEHNVTDEATARQFRHVQQYLRYSSQHAVQTS